MAFKDPNTYFDQFPGFEPDPRLPLEEKSRRLAEFRRWSVKGKRFAREREAFLLAQYTLHLGAIESSKKLEDWQALCRELHIYPMPTSITQCKQALSTKVHVNLIDLLNSRRQGKEVKIFKTRQELVWYTQSTGKYFPKSKAKKNGLLRILLRQILE